jgi:3-hydroxybutyryl-CoA dehydrogenase
MHIANIAKNLDRQVQKNILTETDKQNTLANISISTALDAAKNSDVVIEAASENFVIKEKIFKQLDEICKPETILASNTSSISITKIAAATQRPTNVIGMHFMNPVPVMKLVEIINGYDTSKATTDIPLSHLPNNYKRRQWLPMIIQAL